VNREDVREQRQRAARARRAAQVQVLVDVIWENRSTPGVGDAYLAQQLGIYGRDAHRWRAAIRDLMTDVRVAFPRQHPGFTITRPGGGLVQVVDDPDDRQLNREIRAALRTVRTKRTRASVQAEVWRQNSLDPLQQQLAAVIAEQEHAAQRLEELASRVLLP
jgi:hypothetical protein